MTEGAQLVAVVVAMIAAIVGHRRPAWLIAAVTAHAVLQSAGIDEPYSVGPVSLFTGDFVVVALVTCAVRGFSLRMTKGAIAIVLLLLIVVAGTVRGGLLYGLQTAGNEARAFVYFLLAMLAFAEFRSSEAMALLRNLLHVVGLSMLAMAAVRWTGVSEALWGDTVLADLTAANEYRVLGAAETLLIAELGIVALLYAVVQQRRWARILLITVAFGGVLVLQHRSVWVATAAALLVVFLYTLRRTPSTWFATAIVAASLLAIVYFLVPSGSSLPAALHEWVTEPTRERSTLEWRVQGWEDLLLELTSNDAIDWTIGSPIGRGYDRFVRGGLVSVAPHNFYLQVLLRLGVVGLALLIFVYARIVALSVRQIRSSRMTSLTALALAVAQIAYFLPYGASLAQGAIAGLLLSLSEAKTGRAAISLQA